MKEKKLLVLIASTVMLFSTTIFAESSYSLNQKRIFGKDRYETSSLISKNGWETASDVVIYNR